MWAGQIVLEVNDLLIGVAFDIDATGSALKSALARWVSVGVNAEALPAAFSVKSPQVRQGNRLFARLDYGCNVVARSSKLGEVLDAFTDVIEDLSRTPPPGTLQLPLRVFSKGQFAVLVAADAPKLIGDRRLTQGGVAEVFCWRATIDARLRQVVCGDQSWELVGVLIDSNSTDERQLQRELWLMATAEREDWSVAIHGLHAAGAVVACRSAGLSKALLGLIDERRSELL